MQDLLQNILNFIVTDTFYEVYQNWQQNTDMKLAQGSIISVTAYLLLSMKTIL